MINKKQRLIIIIGIAAIIISAVFSLMDNKSVKKDDNGIEELICAIDGIDEARVIIYTDSYTKSEKIAGIAVIYKGTKSYETEKKIYEMISSLYGISYSRIYVGN